MINLFEQLCTNYNAFVFQQEHRLYDIQGINSIDSYVPTNEKPMSNVNSSNSSKNMFNAFNVVFYFHSLHV